MPVPGSGGRDLPFETHSHSRRDFLVPRGADLTQRLDGFLQWHDTRRELAIWPDAAQIEDRANSTCRILADDGSRTTAINFVLQDYLNLASHCKVKAAATEVVGRSGFHSAGSAALMGNTRLSRALERKLGEFLQAPEIVLYPSGWAAGFGAIRGLVRTGDHVVIDQYASACLQDGANSATDNVRRFRHLDVAYCRDLLEDIRVRDTASGILVVTESLFAVESDTPDLAAMQRLCREFNATLLVDVSHDIGCLGEEGRGQIGIQGVLGKIDIVVGSFAKALASNGGFVACGNRAVKEYLQFFSPTATFSNALSPMQAAVILKAIEIAASAEGRDQRSALMHNARVLRGHLAAAGLEVCGIPSAIVSVKTQSEAQARRIAAELPKLGLLAQLAESGNARLLAPRLRMLVTANHSQRTLEGAAALLRIAFDRAAGSEKPAPQTVTRNVLPFRALCEAA